MSRRIDIRTEILPSGYWQAIDDQTYDVDGDSNGYFVVAGVGDGHTEREAVEDLLNSILGELE